MTKIRDERSSIRRVGRKKGRENELNNFPAEISPPSPTFSTRDEVKFLSKTAITRDVTGQNKINKTKQNKYFFILIGQIPCDLNLQ